MGRLATVPREQTGFDNKQAMLPLDAARSVAFRTGTGNFIYHFRRIEKADWQQYFAGIVHQVVNAGGVREQVFESETALIDLVERTLDSVVGYGNVEMKDWRRALPLQHKLAAGVALRAVGESLVGCPACNAKRGKQVCERCSGTGQVTARSLQPGLCDLVEVPLDAQWGVADGRMTQYHGLIHRFRHPGIADLKRFNFENARVRVSGTSESGLTIYPVRSAVAMALYDDLIESVDGYQVAGRPITEAEDCKKWIDGAHKAAAALALFDQSETVTLE